jgi:predicted RNase H-like nuclease (RuvC/YqgF family)
VASNPEQRASRPKADVSVDLHSLMDIQRSLGRLEEAVDRLRADFTELKGSIKALDDRLQRMEKRFYAFVGGAVAVLWLLNLAKDFILRH